MIEIKMNDVNLVPFTLNEKSVEPFENWVLEVEYKETGRVERMVLERDNDLSLSFTRYNLFNVIEGVDLDLEEGQWDYRVYQTGLTAGNPDILDPDTFEGIVEIGRLRVNVTEQ
jgi:hypothetical protein